MIDLDTIGYYLFMESQERQTQEQEEQDQEQDDNEE